MNLFVIYIKNIHPLFSIIFKFDITLKRLIRFMFLAYQVCTMAIISTLVFGVWYRKDEFDEAYRNAEGYDMDDVTYAVALAIFLSLFT